MLFVCIGNTCRSPMAEAIARGLGGDRVVVHSAGLAPTGRISSGTVEALRSLGYDPRGLRSKGLEEVPLAEMDVVVSLIGGQGLLFIPPHLGSRRISWAIPDPYGEELSTFLAVARDLERRIGALLAELTGHP